ncbi:MAG: glycosyltransferase family 2 protein [Magnetococcales bacterium]|nr:glycosyltransferase family 2 protein [Magnetococcales bacterium]MBF0439530.1 glycosyltransferase family 2 protein [Magnetococcales bacterium]
MIDETRSLISVVIPSYNHGHLIGRTLRSVLDQSYDNFEVIVVDNHSQDQTDQVVHSFADSRIRLLKIHNNGVIAASRNLGIQDSRGEWIAFLDSDDWWTKDKLQCCVDHMMEGVDLIYHDLVCFRDPPSWFGVKRMRFRQVQNPVLVDLLVNGNAIANSSVVVRKVVMECVGGFNESRELVASEDFHVWLKIAHAGYRFVYIPEDLGYYYIHGRNISKNKDMSKSYRMAVADYLHMLNDEQRAQFEFMMRYLNGRYEFLNNNYKNAKQSLLIGFHYKNIMIKIKVLWMLLLMCLASVRYSLLKG